MSQGGSQQVQQQRATSLICWIPRLFSHVQANRRSCLILLLVGKICLILALRNHLAHFSALLTKTGSAPNMVNHSGHNMMMMTPDPHAGHDMEGHSMEGHDGHDMGGHDMKMYFHISYSATILFEGWTVDSWQGMLWSCVVIFIMAALYEGLKVLREYLLQKYSIARIYQVNGQQPLATSEENACHETKKISVGSRMCSVSHLIQTLLHVVQIVLSYFLMLIFMTYNFYLCLAVAVGAGTGYFLFSWKRATVIDINEHCH